MKELIQLAWVGQKYCSKNTLSRHWVFQCEGKSPHFSIFCTLRPGIFSPYFHQNYVASTLSGFSASASVINSDNNKTKKKTNCKLNKMQWSNTDSADTHWRMHLFPIPSRYTDRSMGNVHPYFWKHASGSVLWILWIQCVVVLFVYGFLQYR